MAVDVQPSGQAVSPTVLARQQEHRRGLQVLALLAPRIFWLGLFFILPFLIIIVYSFLTRGTTGNVVWRFNITNYTRLVGDSVYLTVFVRSLWIGILTTVISLLFGYPLALFI